MFEISDDAILAGSDSWEAWKSDETFIKMYSPLAGKTVRVYFVTDPSTKATDKAWYNTRLINAWGPVVDKNGTPMTDPEKAALEMPLRNFPVIDFEEFKNADGVTQRRHRPDPLAKRFGASSGDRKTAEKYARNPDEARPSIEDATLINAVYVSGDLNRDSKYNPKVGRHFLLRLKSRYYRELFSAIEAAKDVDPNFSVAGQCYDLTVEGTGSQTYLVVKRIKDATPVELPDPVNIEGMLTEVRGKVESFVRNLDAVEQAVFHTPEPEIEDDILEEEPEAPAPKASATGKDWSKVPPIQLRKLLTQAGVTVTADTKREELISLAQQHLEKVAA